MAEGQINPQITTCVEQAGGLQVGEQIVQVVPLDVMDALCESSGILRAVVCSTPLNVRLYVVELQGGNFVCWDKDMMPYVTQEVIQVQLMY
jgi:hypothetical protein